MANETKGEHPKLSNYWALQDKSLFPAYVVGIDPYIKESTTEVLKCSDMIKELQENLEEEQQKLGVQKNGTR